jgi:large exoprotein involved in heme utilization and adhesion
VSSASGIFANTTSNSTGKGGSIFLNTNNFNLADSASVSVDSLGKGNGGNLQIQAQDNINLSRQASLLAGTASGEGGNISLQAGNLLLMRYNSLISATAGGTGNGGNITINSPFIVGIPSENSDIIANAFQGRGGNINITTFAIYGLKYRPLLTPKSDITASSDFGVNGNVQINSLGIDATRGLTTVPTRLGNVEEFKDRCQAEIEGNSYTFKINGKGGLPPSPQETLSDDTLMVNWATLPHPGESAALPPNSQVNLQNSPLIEAQGWVINPTGQIILTAQAPTATPNHSGQHPLACNSLPRSTTQVNQGDSRLTFSPIFTKNQNRH